MNMNFFKTMAAALMIAAISFTGCKEEPVKVTGVSLDESALTLVEGQTVTLVAAVAPGDAENKAVKWASSDPAVAAVDGGMVTAVAEGTATITVTTDDGSFTDKCTVTVSADAVAVTGMTLDKPALTLIVGTSETLVATFVPDDATDKTVQWTSSDETVATVSSAGVVTAVSAGTAVIVAATRDGGKTATCAVTVNEPAKTMTMTTEREGNVTLELAGTGTAVINWGDGSEPEEVTFLGLELSIFHTYSGASAHDITVDGQNITYLDCSDNSLTSLDVSKNTALIYLYCDVNRLTSLDVSKNVALTQLYCNDNSLMSLDVSKNMALTQLNCYVNQLMSLDVSKNMALTQLNCYVNELTSLDLSKNTALTKLICDNNDLTSLDLSKNTTLTILSCYGNQLTSLDVSKNTALTILDCFDNQLTSLDVSNCIALERLDCENNQLTSIDVSNTELRYMYCNNNQLTVDGLNALFGTLPVVANSILDILGNPGTDGCDRSIATNKGWSLW